LAVLAVLALGLLATSGPAGGQAMTPTTGHITERAWLLDPAGTLDLSAVRQRPLQVFDGVLSLGYGAEVVWVRLRIDPSARAGGGDLAVDGGGGGLYLRVRPAILDSVWLYDPLQGDAPQGPLGDRHRLDAQDEPGSVLMWRLPRGDAPRELWLRLSTTSTRLAHFEVLDGRQLRLSNARIDHLGALYLGLMAMFVLWALVQVLVPLLGRPRRRPDALVLRFLLYKLLALAFGAGVLGYTRLYAPPWLAPSWVDLSTSLLGVASTGASLRFSQRLLDELAPARWKDGLLWALLAAYPLLMALMLAGQVGLALQANMLLILLMPPMLLLTALGSRGRVAEADDERYGLPRAVVVLYLALTMLFTLLAALPALGWLRGNTLSLYVVLFYSVASGLLMVATLQYRAHRLQSRQVALVHEAQRQRALAGQERRQRLEREQLLDMLGHELKTPLATVRMLAADRQIPASLGQHIGSSVQEMSLLLERVLQASKLDDDALPVRLQTVSLPSLVAQLLCDLPGTERVCSRMVVRHQNATHARCDPYLLGMMVRNLLDNAIKYSPDESAVVLTLALPDAQGRWQFTVANRPGRAGRPDPDRVFDKYYRSPRASHRIGSGLGLYLVRGLAQRLGGELRYQPDEHWICFGLFMGPPTEETSA
jgi:signal transduction histidine kinase